MIPTKDLVYLAILILCVLGMAWWHHDAVLEGEAECQKETANAVAQQRLHDATASQDVIDGLNQDKLRLQAQVDAKPPPPIHTCGRVFYVERPLRPAPRTAGAVSSDPPVGSGDSGVPEGGRGGDVGPGVRALADAGKVRAIYGDRLYEWAMKTR